MNSFRIISHDTGRVPVILYDHVDPVGGSPLILSTLVSFIPSFLRGLLGLNDYDQRAKNILRHIGYQFRGKASGVHGLFHRYDHILCAFPLLTSHLGIELMRLLCLRYRPQVLMDFIPLECLLFPLLKISNI